jgi:hypothetical protein
MIGVMAGRGADFGWASSLPQRLRTAGLTDVRAEGRLVVGNGATPVAGLIATTLRQFGCQMVDAGMTTEAAVARVLNRRRDPEFVASFPLLISAWGRRMEHDLASA